MHPIHLQLVAGLWLWALGSLGLAIVGLYLRRGEAAHAFWFMTAMWAWVDGAIAWYALVWPSTSPAELLPILRFNAGLDVLYIVAGVVLMTRTAPRLRGFGLAVLIQGAFLLAFDSWFWWRCALAIG